MPSVIEWEIYMDLLKKIIQNNLVKAIGINLFYLLFTVLFFEQFATYDDFTMSVQYASGVGEEYAAGQTFMNPIYGKLVVTLNNLIPTLPWFNILFFSLSFLSLTFLTYNILEMKIGRIGVIISNIICIFYAYEMYAGTCFTKVAGITAACGVFIMVNHQKKIVNIIMGAVLVGFSSIIRGGLVETSVICFLLFFVVEEIYQVFYEKRIYLKELLLKCAILALGFVICVCVPKMNFIFSEDEIEEYATQVNENTIRATFQDYEVPSYNERPDIYIDNDITENDIEINREYNYDRYKLTQEVYDSFTKANTTIKKSLLANVFSLNNVTKFFKEYPRLFLSMDVFYALMICVTLIMVCIDGRNFKRAIWGLFFTIFLNFLLMYYMYINGRYNQHRVDITIELLMLIGFIYLNRDIISDVSVKVAGVCIAICILLVPYHYHDDFYMSVESRQSLEEISDFRNEMAGDKDHFYLLGNRQRERDIFCLFELWNITKSKCENKYENTSMLSNFHEPQYLEKYGIGDVYKEAVDNSKIRFVYSSDSNEADKWETYFGHRAGEEVDIALIKQCYGKNVCLVKTKKQSWLSSEQINGAAEDERLKVNLEKEVNENTIELHGNAYLENENSFSQTVYLIIQDSETGERETFPISQFAYEKSNGDDDKISAIDCSVEKPDFYTEDDMLILIVEQNGKLYSKKL